MDCVIGVDGGNTKTDYFLFDTDGNFIDHKRDGSCSHERVGYEEAERILNEQIVGILTKNGLSMSNLKAGAFGLAGIDIVPQQKKLTEIIGRMGIPRFVADNDSFLGIAAGTSAGYGVCSINGTGTVSGGIDPHGRRLQVGGIGELVGDDAGGSYIARCGIRRVYDSFYRCGEATGMTEPVFKLLGITAADELMQAISEKEEVLSSTEMTKVVFAAAAKSDGPALEIMNHVGDQLAKTTAGCVRNLQFDKEVEVVLAGSVWVKAESPVLFESYKRHMARYLPEKHLIYNILKVPPATGAVLWAISLSGTNSFSGEIKQKVISAVEKKLFHI